MWWKIYFWFILISTILGVVLVYGRLDTWDFASWFEVVTSVVAVIGLFAYAYKKDIFNPTFWKVAFWVVVTNWIFDLIYSLTPLEKMYPLPSWMRSQVVGSNSDMLFGIIFALPLLYVVYKLAYKK